MYAKLLCQVRQRNLTKLLPSLPWLHLQCCVPQKSQCHMTRFPWCIDEAHNNNTGVQAYTKHPKVKWACINNMRCKNKDDTIFLGFFHHIKEHFNHHLAIGGKLYTPTLSQNQTL